MNVLPRFGLFRFKCVGTRGEHEKLCWYWRNASSPRGLQSGGLGKSTSLKRVLLGYVVVPKSPSNFGDASWQIVRAPDRWRLWIRSVSHQEVGGVTDLNIRVGVYYRILYGQDIGGWLESTISALGPRPSPMNRIVICICYWRLQSRAGHANLRNWLLASLEILILHWNQYVGGQTLSNRFLWSVLKVGLLAGRVRLPRVRAWFGMVWWKNIGCPISDFIWNCFGMGCTRKAWNVGWVRWGPGDSYVRTLYPSQDLA